MKNLALILATLVAACMMALLVLHIRRDANTQPESHHVQSKPTEDRHGVTWVLRQFAPDSIVTEHNAETDSLGDLMHDFPAAAKWAQTRFSEVQRVNSIRR